MICSECCTIVPDGKFCPNCGAPLTPTDFGEQDFPTFDFENPSEGSADSPYATSSSNAAGAAGSSGDPHAVGGSYTAGVPGARAASSSYTSSDASASYAAGNTSAPNVAGDPFAVGGPNSAGSAGASYTSNTAGDPYAPSATGAPNAASNSHTPSAAGDPYASYASSAAGNHYASNTPNASGNPYAAGAPYSPYATPRTATGYTSYAGGQKAPSAAFILVIVGLVMSLTVVLAFPGVVCCIVGLALNSSYSRKGLVNDRKNATFAMGLIGLILGVLTTILVTAGLMLAVSAAESGDIDVESYLEEVLDRDADGLDEDDIHSIIHVGGHDANGVDGEDADEHGEAWSNGAGGVAGRISDEATTDDAAGGADSTATDDAAGAAGGAAGLIEAQEAFAGEWTLTRLISEGEDRADLVELMDSMGLKASLVLRPDGVAELSLFEQETYSGTWEASSPTSATLTFEGDTVPITIEDGELTLLTGTDDTLCFEKE